MNKQQNLTNKQKDTRIKELELEISLLRQRLEMINGISNSNPTQQLHYTHDEKRIVSDKCAECSKNRTEDKRSNWFVDEKGLTYCEHCFRVLFPNDYMIWQGKHTNPFYPNSTDNKEKENEEEKKTDKESIIEHLKK